MTDFRARCAELVTAIDAYPIQPKAHRDLCNQVRKELNQPAITPPTDEELDEFAVFWWGPERDANTLDDLVQDGLMGEFARAVLNCWGGI